MKKIIFCGIAFACISVVACKNADKKNETAGKKGTLQSVADSLKSIVMDAHDAVMPKMGKVRKAQKEAKRLLDSIAVLPANAQREAAVLKSKMELLINDLSYADFAMDKWMVEFNIDSAENNLEQRIRYLTEEKLKVTKVKEAVLNGLARADSLLKKKF